MKKFLYFILIAATVQVQAVPNTATVTDPYAASFAKTEALSAQLQRAKAAQNHTEVSRIQEKLDKLDAYRVQYTSK